MTDIQSKPSVLIVTKTSKMGGAERILLQVGEGLAKKFDFHLGVLVRNEGNLTSLWPSKIASIPHILFGRFNVIHSHLFLPGFLIGIRRIWDKSFRWVHTVHYSGYEGQSLRWLKRIIDFHFVFPRVDALIAVSPTVSRFLVKLPNSCIMNGSRFSELHSPPPRSMPDELVIGTISMLRPEKGIEDLIYAFKELRDTFPSALLKVAGDGPLLAKIKQLIKDLSIEDSVVLCGYIADVSAFLNTLTIYVQPSRNESFGLGLFEAMAHGIPVIAANVGHLPVLLDSGAYGILVDRNESFHRGLSQAIHNVYWDWERGAQKARMGFERWQGELSLEKLMLAHEKIYNPQSKPSICMISPIVTHSTGGLQRQLYLQSKALAENGHKVYVLQNSDPSLKEAKKSQLWQHVNFIFVPKVTLPGTKHFSLLRRINGLAFVVLGFFSLIKYRKKFSIMHAHQLYSATLVGVLIKLFFKKKLVVKVTASGFFGEYEELKKLPFFGLRKKAFKHIDRVIVLNPEMKLEMLSLDFEEEKLYLLSNSVEISHSSIKATKPEGVATRILFTGRLSREKSLQTLIEAGKILTSKGHKIEIDIVGGSSQERDTTATLKALADQCKDTLNIRFFGHQTVISEFYEFADIFVLPSRSEGMSNSLLEAMSFGLCCVASDIAPNQFVIDDGKNGFLFRQGNAIDLARKLELILEKMITEPRELQRVSEEAKRTISERFSTDFVANSLSRLYLELGGTDQC